MRVVVTHRFTDDLRALHVGFGRGDAELAHRVKDTALGGLEAVANIRQSPRDDDGHRIVEERLGQFVGDVDGLDGIRH